MSAKKISSSAAVLLVSAVTLAAQGRHAGFEFLPQATLDKSGFVSELVRADLDGDGVPDLLRVNSQSAVLLADGAGGFGPPRRIDAQTLLTETLACADIDRDGAVDIVLLPHPAIAGTNLPVRLYRNRGDARFAPPVALPLALDNYGDVLLEDVDKDGRLDALVTSGNDALVHVLAGDGRGGFTPGRDVATVARKSRLVSGDLDGDGRREIVTLGGLPANRIGVHTTGPGGLGTLQVLADAGTNVITSLFVADVTGDGLDDVLYSVEARDEARIFLRPGSQASTAIRIAVLESGARVSEVADLDGNKAPDVVVLHPNGGRLSLLFASRPGQFGAPTSVDVGALSSRGAIADVVATESGARPDLAFGGRASPSWLTLLRNRGDGTFASLVRVAASGALGLDAADVDQDGVFELLTGRVGAITIDALQADGSLRALTEIHRNGEFSDLEVADMDEDGTPDLVAADARFQQSLVFLALGNGAFAAPLARSGLAEMDLVCVADLDRDGHLDLVSGSTTGFDLLRLDYGLGTGAFEPNAPVLGLTGEPKGIDAADADADGDVDLVVSVGGGSRDLALVRNLGARRSASERIGSAGPLCAVADIDGDGALDVAGMPGIAGQPDAGLVWWGRGDGTFLPFHALPTLRGFTAVGDLDGDGLLDLVVSPFDFSLAVHRQITPRTFLAADTFTSDGSPQRILVVDLDGDGRNDVATCDPSDGIATVYRNRVPLDLRGRGKR
jgi:hypothetical protein